MDANDSFDVVCKLIKELTQAFVNDDRSLVAFLASNPDTAMYVKEVADVFISYAWKGSFGKTMDALKAKLSDQEDVFIWMDVACVDQHRAATENIQFDTWAKTFREALKQIGKSRSRLDSRRRTHRDDAIVVLL